MTLRSIAAAVVVTAIGATVLPVPDVAGQDTAIRVLVSDGMKAALEALRPQCERAIGRPIALEFSSTTSIKKEIEAGEAFDVTIITSEAVEDLISKGKLTTNTRAGLARSELGIGIRAGASRPDIHTPEALKQTLRRAKSITYPRDGASRGYIEEMFERLGITAEIKSRVIVASSSGTATGSVATGKAELVIIVFSEIVPIQGVEILGALPGEFRYDIPFAAAASGATKNAEAARALIAYLSGPKAAAVYKSKNLEPSGTRLP
jgi:molybdate transport system substrate-binding protein